MVLHPPSLSGRPNSIDIGGEGDMLTDSCRMSRTVVKHGCVQAQSGSRKHYRPRPFSSPRLGGLSCSLPYPLSLPTNTCHPEGAQRLKDLVSSRVRVVNLASISTPADTKWDHGLRDSMPHSAAGQILQSLRSVGMTNVGNNNPNPA